MHKVFTQFQNLYPTEKTPKHWLVAAVQTELMVMIRCWHRVSVTKLRENIVEISICCQLLWIPSCEQFALLRSLCRQIGLSNKWFLSVASAYRLLFNQLAWRTQLVNCFYGWLEMYHEAKEAIEMAQNILPEKRSFVDTVTMLLSHACGFFSARKN